MTRMSTRKAWTVATLLMLSPVLPGLGGCVHVEFTKPAWPTTWFEPATEAPPTGPVCEVTSIWRDGIVVLPDPAAGGAPTPGFMGKICLTGDQGLTVAAEGSIIVQLYDDLQTPSNPPVPREMWTISSEILKGVVKKESMLGWNYNLWLPWNQYSPKISQVTLVVQYKDKTGREIWSKPHFMTVRDKEGARQATQITLNAMEKKPQ